MSGPHVANPGVDLRAIKARKDGLLFLLLGCAIFLLMGSALEMAAPVSTVDFRVVYYSARCLLDHRDPYNPNDLDATYRLRGGEAKQDTPRIRRTERLYNYLPTAFPITVPFALLPFVLAQKFWLVITAAAVGLASYLMWNVGVRSAPLTAGILVGLSLASSELFLILGNPAGIAIALCVIGVWCISQRRFVLAGLVCFAISLMLKPHDGGLIWLYLLVSGPANRKRAWQILGFVVILSAPAILWVWHTAPGWLHELQTTFRIYSSHGDVNDPGPASTASHGIGMIISLQAVLSLFRDDPAFYDGVTYLICGPLIVAWLSKVLRSRPRGAIDWFALAPIAALSMLPVYHRIYDAHMLLLAIPACSMLRFEGGARAWLVFGAVALAIGITGSLPWAIFLLLLNQGHLRSLASSPHLLVISQVAPIPLTLLFAGTVLLWVYLRRDSRIPNESEALGGTGVSDGLSAKTMTRDVAQ